MKGELPLTGIRVVDFGRFIAGPYCGMLLADMGADVIRVDRRQGSEDRYIAPITKGGEGGGFLSLNRNKRSLTLDTGKPESAEIIRRLLRKADVVIANLPNQILKKMGLDYESLRNLKPDIILARISTFAPDGPYADRVGFDAVAQAMCGAMTLTGTGEEPLRDIVPFMDYGTALHTAFGIMVALFHRTQMGEGQLVDGSLLATGITFMQNLLAEEHVTGVARRASGNRSFYAAPSDTYRARDGWIMVSVVGNEMFERWAKLVGRPRFTQDPRFATDQLRADNHEPITSAMSDWTRTRSMQEAVTELEKARIPAGPVQQLNQVLADPQVQARRLLKFLNYPGAAKPVPLAETAVQLSSTPGSIRHRAPVLGEHTNEILLDLGYSMDEINELRAQKVV